jgi:transcriptional regulator with XRE-family HTH domain
MGMHNLATYLTTLRASHGFSRARLADLVGTTEMTILRIERHGQEPGGGLLVRLIDTLGGSWDVVTRLIKADDSDDALQIVLSEAQATGARPIDADRLSRFLELVAEGSTLEDAARAALSRP